MNRRGFFNRAPTLPAFAVVEEVAPPSYDFTTLRAARRAMATLFEIIIPFGNPLGPIAAGEALDLVDELEDQLTVYRAASEVSRLNETAAFADVTIESGLFELLSQAAVLTRETRGAFDIATGALIKAWGFYQRSGKVPSVAERVRALQRTGMKHVILNAEQQTVRFRREGLQINLGGIGKGYALDRAGELLQRDWGLGSALLHGGTSSVLAIGTPPGRSLGWAVSLNHPWRPDHSLGVVNLCNQALGTSAATYQYFEYNGRKLGHLLNPRNGWPAEGVQQVSVIAPTAAEADALSTAFFVMGLDETRIYCQSRPHIGAIILIQDDEQPRLVNIAPGAFTLPPS